jgi:UMP-CMP kinase
MTSVTITPSGRPEKNAYHSHQWSLPFCPFSLGLFLGTVAFITYKRKQQQQQQQTMTDSSDTPSTPPKESATAAANELPPCQVVFVLGGPGSGKGTQCSLVQESSSKTSDNKQWHHESAGELLRTARQHGGLLGDTINQCIAQGQLVPSTVTCQLIAEAMQRTYQATGVTRFLIDGFPRSQGNLDAWNATMAPRHTLEFVLYLECPEEIMIDRLLDRGQTSGRSDDNLEVIRKRLLTNQQETEPIVQHYELEGKLRRVRADQPVEQVHAQVMALIEAVV